jgi:transcriptional regulator with XRE-family HTH domain
MGRKPAQPTKGTPMLIRNKVSDADRLIGERIRKARESADMTLADVAAKAGVTLAQIQKYETGNSQISLRRLIEIAKALDRPLSYFLKAVC